MRLQRDHSTESVARSRRSKAEASNKQSLAARPVGLKKSLETGGSGVKYV